MSKTPASPFRVGRFIMVQIIIMLRKPSKHIVNAG